MNIQSIDSLWQPKPVCDDARLRSWLTERGSLTRRIEDHCRDFRVDLLSQTLDVVGRDECTVLGVRPRACCMVREVSLNCARRSLVFAHSVIAPRALKGPWRMLATLGTRPLGAALFADPRVRRYELRYRALNRGHELYRRACALLARPPVRLWARRSLFVLRGSRLLVTEVFLPDILALTP